MSEQYPDGAGLEEVGDGDYDLVFRYDGRDPIRIRLDQSSLPALAALIHGKIEPGQNTPISLHQLRPGKQIAVQAVSPALAPNGSVLLRFQAEIDDRTVTIPLGLKPALVQFLREALADPHEE